MSPAEIHAECRAIAEMVGLKADVRVSIDQSGGFQGEPIFASVFPQGITGEGSIHLSAHTFEDALAGLRVKWEECRAAYDAEIVRRMALKIIETTEATGECTDAGLRQHFDASEIARFGADAVRLANEMAANGPFSIVPVAQPNAA